MAACTARLSHSPPDGDQCLVPPQESVKTANKAPMVSSYSPVSKAEKSSFIPVSFPNIPLRFAGSLAFV